LYLTETHVKTVARAEDTPSRDTIVPLLLEFDPKKTGVEAGRHIEIADGNVQMINAPRVHWRGSPQPRTRFTMLDVRRRPHA
jgi:hypothetical protein